MMLRILSVVLTIGFLAKVGPVAPLSTRIVGGQDASPGSWPWQASLQTDGNHFCGGSLINSRWILTAAHCFNGSATSPNVTVYLGMLTFGSNNSSEEAISVSQVFVHPDYNSSTYNNDIALLQLSSSVNFINYTKPVCLAAAGSTFYNGTPVWVTGWGNTAIGENITSPETLQEVGIPVVGNRECSCLNGVENITSNMMCAGLLAGGKDSCQGDSGGPLVVKQSGVWVQAGIVSFGIGCALPNHPGVYTRVSQYQGWINQQITSNRPCFITVNSTGTDGDLSVSCPGLPPVTTNTTAHTTTVLPSSATAVASSSGTSTVPTSTNTTSNTTSISTTVPPVICGTAKLNNATGGGNSSAGAWPWMASLQRHGTHVCGGTLVAEQFVLSSADCFSGSSNASDWTVILGRLKQNSTNPNEVSLNVTNITLSSGAANSVAVLKLSRKPTLTDYIQPICVDLGGDSFPINTPCWAAGWGSGGGVENTLQQFNTTVLDCGNTSSSNSSICTGAMPLVESNKGGPLMCKIGQSWVQAAVLTMSGNSTKTTRASVQVFTKTSNFSKFLQTAVESFPPKTIPTTTTATTTTKTTTTTTKPVGSSPSSFPSITSLLLLSLPALIQAFC